MSPGGLGMPAAGLLCVLAAGALRLPGLSSRELLTSAVAGALAVPLAMLVGLRLAGSRAGVWAGVLVALSPIHTLASRAAGPTTSLVLLLFGALWLATDLESRASVARAMSAGAALGVLAACGVAAFSAVALVCLVWLACRKEARGLVALTLAAALAVAALLGLIGLARSPFDYGAIPAWIPATSAAGIVRCSGASFTRIAGIEYHLVVPQARYVLPVTALFVGLMGLGAARLPPRVRVLLVAGALLPFGLAMVHALVLGRVTPLQATRLVAALPFMTTLLAAGLSSLRGVPAWAAGATVAGTLAGGVLLALGR